MYEARDYEPRQHRHRRHDAVRRRESETTTSGAPSSTGRSTTTTCWNCWRSPTRTRPSPDMLPVRSGDRPKRGGCDEPTSSTKAAATTGRLTYTGYLTDDLSMKALYGENERSSSPQQPRTTSTATASSTIAAVGGRQGLHVDTRRARRATTRAKPRAWTSSGRSATTCCASAWTASPTPPSHEQFYPGPDRLRYDVFATTPGATIERRARPAGVTAYVRTRAERSRGSFETLNIGVLPRGQLVDHRQLRAQPRRAHRGLRQQERRRRQLHQDRRHDRAALRLLLGHEGRGPHQAVRQRRPLLPAGRERHQHQAGRRLPRRAQLLRVQRLRDLRPTTASTCQRPILGAAARRRGQLAGRRHGGRPAQRGRRGHGSGLPGRSRSWASRP